MPVIQEMVAWLASFTGGGPVGLPVGHRPAVQFTIATNQQNNRGAQPATHDYWESTSNSINVVAFGIGNLILDKAATGLTGVGNFLFSDRRGSGEPYGSFGPPSDPIRVSIDRAGLVTIVLVRWGNATYSFPTTEANNVLSGFGSSIGNQALPAQHAITLAPHFVPT